MCRGHSKTATGPLRVRTGTREGVEILCKENRGKQGRDSIAMYFNVYMEIMHYENTMGADFCSSSRNDRVTLINQSKVRISKNDVQISEHILMGFNSTETRHIMTVALDAQAQEPFWTRISWVTINKPRSKRVKREYSRKYCPAFEARLQTSQHRTTSSAWPSTGIVSARFPSRRQCAFSNLKLASVASSAGFQCCSP